MMKNISENLFCGVEKKLALFCCLGCGCERRKKKRKREDTQQKQNALLKLLFLLESTEE